MAQCHGTLSRRTNRRSHRGGEQMEQRSFSKLGGLLGVITFLFLVAAAFANDPETGWSIGSSPLAPALWIALLGVIVLILSRTSANRILPLRTLGMWAFAVMLGGAAAAVVLGLRGEWDLAWRMLVLGASGWLAQFLIGIPYRADQESAINVIARQLGTSKRETVEFLCSRLASAGGNAHELALSVTDDPRLAPLEHAAIEEVVAEHCPEHRQVWELAKDILLSESQGRIAGGRELLADLVQNPSMEPDQIRAAMARQSDSSNRFLAAAAGNWPESNEQGWPTLRANVQVWRDQEGRWLRAALEASLSPGVMTGTPNLMFRIEPDAEGEIIWSQSVYLLARPDISHGLPSYELRWSDPKTYEQKQTVIASESENVALLADYLQGHWRDVSSDPVVEKFLAPQPSVFPSQAAQP